MDIAKKIASEIQVRPQQVQAVMDLIDEGNTVPFIARYRKEAHGALNDEQIRTIDERLGYLRNLEERKEQVIKQIAEQEKLTPELEKAIREAETAVLVEDLYRPYKPKRKTRAGVAKEKGLEPLADLIWEQTGKDFEKEAEAFLDPEKEVNSIEDALSGAKDILAERISDCAEYRTYLRETCEKEAVLCAEAKNPEEKTVYDMYYAYERPLGKVPNHALLAINRGEKEKILSVKLRPEEEKLLTYLEKKIITGKDKKAAAVLSEVIRDSFSRLIWPSLERELRSSQTEKAEDEAIKVFGLNLQQLLMQPPVKDKVVLGWDPAFRTGCKLAVVDKTGKVLDTVVIYPTAPQNKVEEAKKILKKLVDTYKIDLISCGNGTASRESEQVIAEFLHEVKRPLSYCIVNEAGASVYSASKLATEEFPEFDVGQRSAASIARRLQDPLAELVKIDPRSIGVGQYQHDMDQKKLGEALSAVVEDCVNRVGVDVNTASAALLEYVAGVNKTIAKNIVSYREEHGPFESREELTKVPKLGPKAYTQCAGFLRIPGAKEILDATAVHPESYEAAKKVMDLLSLTPLDVGKAGIVRKAGDLGRLSKQIGVGELTLKDIVGELEKPARDPRDEMPKPILRQDVLEMKDLKEGMILKGTVRNVIDFGAFVDIGVHQDGLVHISQMSDKFIKHPLEVVSVGDIVEVKVVSVDISRKRIQLSMKLS